MRYSTKVDFNTLEYWQKIKNEDKQAFEQVFKTYYEVLCNYANSITKDMNEAEEIVQNTFFNMWSRKESIEITSSLKSYLYRAVHNDCLNRVKHSKVKRVYAEELKATMDYTTADSSANLQRKELGEMINKAIESLPEQCGQVFKLSRFENMKYSEIAQHLQISVKTVENHMGKALRLLRDQLKDYLPLIVVLLDINWFF